MSVFTDLGVSPEQFVKNRYRDGMLLIYRDRFEMFLAEEIVKHKGEVCVKSFVEDVKITSKGVSVKVKMENQSKMFYAKALLCADGVEGYVTRKAGIDVRLDPVNIGSCYSATVSGICVDPSRYEMAFIYTPQIFFYWIFPSSETEANIGVGVPGLWGNRAKEVFKDFFKRRPKIWKGNMLREIVGCLPIAPPYPKPYANRVLVAGTAARFVLAEGGEGISYAVTSGIKAAEIFKKAVEREDFSEEFLSSYKESLKHMYRVLLNSYNRLINKFPAPIRKLFKLEKHEEA